MPKLWSETVESHRIEVRDAILNSTAALVAHNGPFKVTMSEIAETVGIGRATLYKYFASVGEILDAWHQRHIEDHLEQLREEASNDRPPLDRLTAVLTRYAQIQRRQNDHGAGDHDVELTTFLHRPDGVAQAAVQKLHSLVAELVTEAAAAGEIRSDIPPDELTHYCLSALQAAKHLDSTAATNRLVGLTLSGLQD